MGRTVLLGSVVAAAIAAFSCSTDESIRCLNELDLNISSAATPEISWTPSSCRVSRVIVSKAGQDVWWLGSRNGLSTILPPIYYGTEPATATEVAPAIPLSPGTYQVQLFGIRDPAPPNQGKEWYPVASRFFSR